MFATDHAPNFARPEAAGVDDMRRADLALVGDHPPGAIRQLDQFFNFGEALDAGAEFARAYGSKALSEIDAGMSEMPMDNPGSLKREDVASLIAYFLEMNKYPAGQKALSGEADALKAIMVAPRP